MCALNCATLPLKYVFRCYICALDFAIILTMLLFAILTLPSTYHVEVAARQVGFLNRINHSDFTKSFYAKAHVKEFVA